VNGLESCHLACGPSLDRGRLKEEEEDHVPLYDYAIHFLHAQSSR